MVAFCAVIITLLCFINLWNYHSITRQQDATLQSLLEADSLAGSLRADTTQPPIDDLERFSPEVPYMIRFFSVHYDNSNNVIRVNQDYIASISEADAKAYADKILKEGKTCGYESGYRYLSSTVGDETVVIFLNSERELQTMKSLLLITVIIAAACLVVVFVLIALFSKRAIAPYMKNLEAQKQFVTNASHELKTPLTAISASADVLELEVPDNEWVKNIQSQSSRLSKLISNLVLLSRLDEENPFPARSEFSLTEALWEITDSFSSLAQAKGKTYTQNIEEGLALNGDRTAIQQMVSILLDNAVKYSKDKANITLSAAKYGKKIEIIVSNDIDENNIFDTSRLFDRFYRADESHSNKVGGTGIGLSIAKATVEAHGGKISAETEDGKMAFRILI